MTSDEFIAWCLMTGNAYMNTGVAQWVRWDCGVLVQIPLHQPNGVIVTLYGCAQCGPHTTEYAAKLIAEVLNDL